MRLNIVLHDIKDICEPGDSFSLSFVFIKQVLKVVEKVRRSNRTAFSDYRVYFDDGYRSVLKVAEAEKGFEIDIDLSRIVLGITTNYLDKEGHLSTSELIKLSKQGVKIASHGVSHAALAIFEGDVLCGTNLAGEYRNMPEGKNASLSEYEVLYQAVESKRALSSIGIETDEFIFPYGLYNKGILEKLYESNLYNYLSTCDEYVDTGSYIRPRYLIWNTKTIEEIAKEISQLLPYNPDLPLLFGY